MLFPNKDGRNKVGLGQRERREEARGYVVGKAEAIGQDLSAMHLTSPSIEPMSLFFPEFRAPHQEECGGEDQLRKIKVGKSIQVNNTIIHVLH